jgi:hypothetical protein
MDNYPPNSRCVEELVHLGIVRQDMTLFTEAAVIAD